MSFCLKGLGLIIIVVYKLRSHNCLLVEVFSLKPCLSMNKSMASPLSSVVVTVGGRKFLIEVKKDKNFVISSSCCNQHEPIRIIYADGQVSIWSPCSG